MKEFILSLRSSIRRRRYLYYFKGRYVIEQLLKREGNCNNCKSNCCKHTRSCIFLKDNKCSIYNGNIPFFCWVFPIDEKDIKLSGIKECDYWWRF